MSVGFTEMEKRETCSATGSAGNVGRKRMGGFLSVCNCIWMLQRAISKSGGLSLLEGNFLHLNFVKKCRPDAGRRGLGISSEFVILFVFFFSIHIMAIVVIFIGSSESLGITRPYQTYWVEGISLIRN